MRGDAARDVALPTSQGACATNKNTVLFSLWVSLYLLPVSQSCSSLGHGTAESHQSMIRIFFSEYVCKVIRRFKYVNPNMMCRASEVLMFLCQVSLPGAFGDFGVLRDVTGWQMRRLSQEFFDRRGFREKNGFAMPLMDGCGAS
jgi:hypothetical protein